MLRLRFFHNLRRGLSTTLQNLLRTPYINLSFALSSHKEGLLPRFAFTTVHYLPMTGQPLRMDSHGVPPTFPPNTPSQGIGKPLSRRGLELLNNLKNRYERGRILRSPDYFKVGQRIGWSDVEVEVFPGSMRYVLLS